MSDPSFYETAGLHTEIYDVFASERAGPDLPFWLDCAHRFGGPVLDAACGTGRVSWALAEAGIEVVGFDLSEPMLERARAKATAAPEAVVEFHRADMAEFDLGREFALVIVPFRAFQFLLTADAQLAALACFRRHLRPEGHLVIDLFDPRLEYLVDGGRPADRLVYDHPNRPTEVEISSIRMSVDPVSQTFDETWTFTEKAGDRVLRIDKERMTMRWTYRWEAHHLLRRAGFDVVAEYSDFDRSPPTYGREQIWVARAPAA